ncbi:MAG: F0F1 ATP synthase subunit gamma [Planctomycetaceae bacterium]|nr:F0F1 ATP synthase subunit gamma [Planctomycetales bacterium]MCB9925083.1 F0F1 ATP synthase subunit gamma [Planctomycetaceae bacterium]
MKRQQYLQHRLQTLSALRDAVAAMRSLSAHHYRRVRQTLPAARKYRTEMDTIIAEIGLHQPLHIGAPLGLLVIASDLGLCGDYNSRLSRLAVSEAKRHRVQTIFSVGHRARAALKKYVSVPIRKYDAPASIEGLSQLLLGLAQDVLESYTASRISGLQVVSAAFEGVGHFSPHSVRVLPIEPIAATSPLRRSPYTESSKLTSSAVREFLYITLYEILLDAIAAEHGMRLLAAESALEWLDSSTTTTSRRLANARSEASTQELLDIVAGGRRRLQH